MNRVLGDLSPSLSPPFFEKQGKNLPFVRVIRKKSSRTTKLEGLRRRRRGQRESIEEKIRKPASFLSSKAMDRSFDFLPLDGDDSMLAIAFPSRHMSIPRQRLNQAAHLSWPGRGRGLSTLRYKPEPQSAFRGCTPGTILF